MSNFMDIFIFLDTFKKKNMSRMRQFVYAKKMGYLDGRLLWTSIVTLMPYVSAEQ